ncbi:MAG: chemotaxis protein CheA, partial [Lachnospiraceae bacterium]|nr:chemotaxis protein CheA [Lachnospiraceae bacterium]
FRVAAENEIPDKMKSAPISRQTPAATAQESSLRAADVMNTENEKSVEAGKAPVVASTASSSGKGVQQSFISVNVHKIDKLMDLMGEIVTTESMVIKNPDIANMHLENFDKQARQLRKLTDEMQEVVMSIRMIPISSTFHKMKRIVRDMCKKVNKEANLVLVGEKTEVDKNVLDALSDPLMHLIRNSMDHGLESPEDRQKVGKNPVGTITLEAKNTGGDIIVSVSDDGRGLDKDKLIAKAISRGLVNKPESEITDKEAYNFILMPGFSTKEKVTEFSGRGVGMDVVRQNLESIGGSISIDSELGNGMTITMHIPLTLAIIEGMNVSVGKSKLIIPILNIKESLEARNQEIIKDPDGNDMVILRGECFRIIKLYEEFNIHTDVTDINDSILVLVEAERGTACLMVDELLGEQQAVIKPLPQYITNVIGKPKGVSGCSILGDGNISLIIDINSLLN